MSRRNTKTGGVLENMVVPALVQGGYKATSRTKIGMRLGVGGHFVDSLAEKDGKKYLISLKWQQRRGTAEQKVPFEVISMIEALHTGDYAAAYIVLGGTNWRFRDFYLAGGLTTYIPKAPLVRIIGLDAFIALANEGRL